MNIIFFLSIFTLNYILSAQEQSGPFANLSSDILSQVCIKICKYTGTPSLRNEKDIPVIEKYLQRMSHVCKCWNKVINSDLCSKAIIDTVSNRFKIHSSEAAFSIKTRGTYEWLEKYLTNFELTTFLATWELFKILSNDHPNKMSENFKPSFSSGYTEQGLIFFPSIKGFSTPWGSLDFFNDIQLSSFLLEEKNNDRTFDKIIFKKTLLKDPDLEVFEIRQVKSYVLPSYQVLSIKRDSYILSCIWKRLKKIAFPEQVKKRKTSLVSPALNIANTSPSIPMSNLADLPNFLKTILVNLEKGTVIQSQSPYYGPYKTFPLAETDSRLCERVCSLIRSNVDNKLCILSTYGLESYAGNAIEKNGLVSLYFADEDDQLSASDMDVLETACHSTIKNIQKGWRFASLAENPFIFHKQSEEEYYLLLKDKKNFALESDLIALCADKFGLLHNPTQVDCENKWKEKGKHLENRNPSYLWIKKESFKKVVKLFGFKIENLPAELSQ